MTAELFEIAAAQARFFERTLKDWMEHMNQMSLELTGGTARGVTWDRYPNCCRADYKMVVDGEPNGLWIRGVQHPTALRPYYIVMPNRTILARKYRTILEAKAAAIIAVRTLGRAV